MNYRFLLLSSTFLLIFLCSFSSYLYVFTKNDLYEPETSYLAKEKDCLIENYQKIELCLIETFSKEWYDDLCHQDKENNHRFYFHIITDQEGRIISVQKDKLFKGMTEYEFEQFAVSLKRNYNICIFPPRGSSLEEFKAKHGNRLPFTFLYFPYKTRVFLEGWRLNKE